jgi:hypothetical protein
LTHLESLGFSVETFVQYVTGIKNEIPSSRMDLLPVDTRAAAMRIVDSVRPSLSPQFINLPNEDLIAANVVLVARRK